MKFVTRKQIIPTVYISIGLPGSGKTFWWDSAISHKKIPLDMSVYINPELLYKDMIVEGDFNINIINRFSLSHLKNALLLRKPIIYMDGNFITLESRRPIINVAKKAQYKVVCLYFVVPKEVCYERTPNKKKLIDFAESQIIMNEPTCKEGFDDVWSIKNF